MQIKEILYVEPVDQNLHEQDPLVIVLKQRLGEIPVIVFKANSRVIFKSIVKRVRLAEVEGKRCTIIINVFLRPQREGVGFYRKNFWEPYDSLLKKLLDSRRKRGYLQSLKLLWRLWTKARGKNADLLMTTNNIQMSPRSWQMLMSVYEQGNVCNIYRWFDEEMIDDHVADLCVQRMPVLF